MNNEQDQSKFLEQHLLNQQIQQIHQQIQSLNEQINELERLHEDLLAIKDQEDSKTFSALGGGIYVESEIKKADSVLLSVGADVVVKKPKEEALRLVAQQREQLIDIKGKLESELNKVNMSILSSGQ